MGPANVLAGADALAPFERATFATTQRVRCVVRPASTDEVQRCVRLANELGAPLWPISGGKNFGYGSRVPFRDGSVILDLGRMNRIVDFDRRLAYATVEPGVSFDQLYERLEEEGGELMLNVTGGDPAGSVLANAIERGLGKGPFGDRFSGVCNFEVVLPNGDRLETGFDRFPGARSAPISKWGVGPYIEGLFSQSNLGIVTRVTILLAPRPAHFTSFSYDVEGLDDLERVVDVVAGLRRDGTLRTPVLLMNDFRWASMVSQYPFARMNGKTPLPHAELIEIRKTENRGSWVGDGALYASTFLQAVADRRHVTKQLRPFVEGIRFWGRHKSAAAVKLAGLAAKLGRRDERFRYALTWERSMYRGVPMRHTNGTTYWRKTTPRPRDPSAIDPDRDRCGALWYSPCLPASGADVRRAADIVERVSYDHGFEPNVGFNFVTGHALDMTGALLYDRDVPGEDERAMACHDALLAEMQRAGYYPYRLGLQSMGTLPPAPVYDALLARIRTSLDPNAILAPGRYEPQPK